jgi:hypothetical protein
LRRREGLPPPQGCSFFDLRFIECLKNSIAFHHGGLADRHAPRSHQQITADAPVDLDRIAVNFGGAAAGACEDHIRPGQAHGPFDVTLRADEHAGSGRLERPADPGIDIDARACDIKILLDTTLDRDDCTRDLRITFRGHIDIDLGACGAKFIADGTSDRHQCAGHPNVMVLTRNYADARSGAPNVVRLGPRRPRRK